jgi:glyoxylase-like metal-dependent hydrolase (beta-lactamase superfamily II)
MEIAKGVDYIESYAGTAVVAGDRLLLVDAGTEDNAKTILDYLAAKRWKPTDIAHIAITHTHPDHVGGLATLKERTGARVAAHEADADYVSRTKPYPGPPGPQRHRAVPVDRRLRDGERYEGLLVIHGPGHTPGSIALLDEGRSILFAGDTLRTEGGVGPMDDKYNIDPGQHRQSLKKLAAHEFETLVCGHGPPIRGGAGKQVKAVAAKL